MILAIRVFTTKSDMWQPASTAPLDHELRLAVFDASRPRIIQFPCLRVAEGWIEAATGTIVDVLPTHWRNWQEPASARVLGFKRAF